MKIAAGKFKAECLKLMDRVNEEGLEMVITKRGKPVAKLVPAGGKSAPKSAFGILKGTAQVKGDIIAPTGETWEADA